MPRPLRKIETNCPYHCMNRANFKREIFKKDEDYLAFLTILAEGLERYPVDLFAYCLMPNHWHLLLSPREPDALAGYMRWVGVTHVRRYHSHYHTSGGGHLGAEKGSLLFLTPTLVPFRLSACPGRLERSKQTVRITA